MIVEQNFGKNELLFCLYAYTKFFHKEPATWYNLFEGMNYINTMNLIEKNQRSQAAAMRGVK